MRDSGWDQLVRPDTEAQDQLLQIITFGLMDATVRTGGAMRAPKAQFSR